jgi:hypothetical protein
MPSIHRKGLVLEIPISQNPNSTLKEGAFVGPSLFNWLVECHGFLHNAILILTSLAFVIYLAFQAKKSFRKLSNGRSSIMIAYYCSLWLVSLLNFAWSCFQVCGFLQFRVLMGDFLCGFLIYFLIFCFFNANCNFDSDFGCQFHCFTVILIGSLKKFSALWVCCWISILFVYFSIVLIFSSI